MKQNTLFGIGRFAHPETFIESGGAKYAHQLIQLYDSENAYSGSIFIKTYLLDDKKDENYNRLWKFDLQFSFAVGTWGVGEVEFRKVDVVINRRELNNGILELLAPVGMGKLHIVGYPNYYGSL